jgi:hypothetical protein
MDRPRAIERCRRPPRHASCPARPRLHAGRHLGNKRAAQLPKGTARPCGALPQAPGHHIAASARSTAASVTAPRPLRSSASPLALRAAGAQLRARLASSDQSSVAVDRPALRRPHASLLHNALFCKVARPTTRKLALGGRPLRALRVRKNGVMQSDLRLTAHELAPAAKSP